MGTRILLVGRGLFRDGLAHALRQEPSVTIVGSVSAWHDVPAEVALTHPDVLIVDEAAVRPATPDTLPLLGPGASHLKIIYLTLDTNRAVVDDLRQVIDLSLTDLVTLLRASPAPLRGGAESEHDSSHPGSS